MSTYTKHFTQLSTDGNWELSFDVTAETPEEAYSQAENQSFVQTIRNYKMIYRGSKSITMYRGYVHNAVKVDGEWVIGLRRSFLKHTFEPNQDVTDIMILSVASYTKNFYVNHDASGVGILKLYYSVYFTNEGATAAHTTIDFYADAELNRIDIMNLPFTEMSETTKKALIEGSAAIRTRLLVNNYKSETVQTLSDETVTPQQLVLTEADSIKTWELNDERYVPNTGFIGQFVARTLSGELHNISDDFSIEDTDVELQIGVVELGTRYQLLATENGNALLDEDGNMIYVKELGNDKVTWYTLGNFLVTKPEDDEVADNTKFEAFDYTTKFNADFNADYADSTYPTSFNKKLEEGPVTLKWLADYTCTQVGVVFANETFTNSDFQVASNQFTQGQSCRDVMKAIAEVAFGWCRVGWDNKCYIDEPQTVSVTSDDANILTNDNYYSLTTQKQVYGPINRVVIGMSGVTGQEAIVQDDESIAQNGTTDILIMDNPILYTPELRESVKESARKLFGLYYSPVEMETPGHPWLTGKELIDVQDMEGNSRFTYPFNRTLNYTGHIKSKVVAPATTAQEKDTEYKQQIFKTIKDIGIRVDAQEGTIKTVNASVEATKSGLESIERRFETEITDTYSKTQIQEIINGTAADGTAVTSVTTTAGTFDKNGLTIEQTGSLTKTNINSNGMIIYNTSGTIEDDRLLDVNSEGVDAKNIKVSKYLNIGSHSRMEDYKHTDYTQGTGVFWIGSDY